MLKGTNELEAPRSAVPRPCPTELGDKGVTSLENQVLEGHKHHRLCFNLLGLWTAHAWFLQVIVTGCTAQMCASQDINLGTLEAQRVPKLLVFLQVSIGSSRFLTGQRPQPSLREKLQFLGIRPSHLRIQDDHITLITGKPEFVRTGTESKAFCHSKCPL